MDKAMVVHAIESATQEVKDLYTRRGGHEGCGECCGRFLPLDAAEAVTLRVAARELGVRPHDDTDVVNMMCPFLDELRRCMVYERRPEICRAYNCAEHARRDFSGMRREIHGKKQMRDVCEVIA